MMERSIFFGPNRVFGEVPLALFGNKAAVLSRMAEIGVPVPPGFALSVQICEEYFAEGRRLPRDVPDLLRQGISQLEEATGLVFGSARRPLLVSVRSGAPVSMPGIMETVLNVGLNRETVRGLISRTGNPRFAWDSYRRFLSQFGEVVRGIHPSEFREILREVMEQEDVPDESELATAGVREAADRFERLFAETGVTFPTDTMDQLLACTEAVIASWESPRAEAFRRLGLARDATGTAVVVQAMVFGNLGAASGAGVAFTRNPWNGARELTLDFRFGAQGEEVVSGDRSGQDQVTFARVMPEQYAALRSLGSLLEREFSDMLDLEFTIEEGRLFLLQCRAGKRTPLAALQIAVDLVREGLIDELEGARRLDGIDPDLIRIRRIRGTHSPVARGTPASGGVAVGTCAFSAERAEQDAVDGPVVLVRPTASPDDIGGIDAATGLLVARGGRTSHAAVVARELGVVCVVNCQDLQVDSLRHRCSFGETVVREGEVISIDGDTGDVFLGEVEVVEERPDDLLACIQDWPMGDHSSRYQGPVGGRR
ncbi:MAG TPA: PEP/pyruvate-binding domain-containing protein [Methanoregulaceae archaeon]|nr:PEP/pyruvate-binding domain-containing protein [Methanoregulaceae archaeon]